MASYLQALRNDGEWLIRIEDIDPPRQVPGSDSDILRSLEAHGFEWSETPLYQSSRLDAYEATIKELISSDLAYICHCTRQQINKVARPGPLGQIYPGSCSTLQHPYEASRAVRLRTPDTPTTFADKLQGSVSLNLGREVGDFVLRRGDGLIAYHLAVTVDDEFQGITEVVRGSDLLIATTCHLQLQTALSANHPQYMHVPIAVDADGEKLSKHTGAEPLDAHAAAANLLRGLRFLGQSPPKQLESAPTREIWAWAAENWSPDPLKNQLKRPLIGL